MLHLQCNAGQDSLSLAAETRAQVTGVDLSDEAIAFAKALAALTCTNRCGSLTARIARFERVTNRELLIALDNRRVPSRHMVVGRHAQAIAGIAVES